MIRAALTPAEHALGFAGRRSLAPDEVLVFVMPGPTMAAFWNRATYVPLDLAFLSADGTVLETREVRSLEETGGQIEHYSPARPYALAIEAPRGWLERCGIRVGRQIV